MTEDERRALVDDIVAALDTRGAPTGLLLADIIEARRQLSHIDTMLRRLQEQLVTGVTSRNLPEL